MIDMHVYGHLKEKLVPGAKMAENTVITLPHVQNESFLELLTRIGISTSEIGDCFINHVIVTDMRNTQISDGSRVAIFSSGMYLIDGGQYIKGHGYITKQPPREISHY
ncbi:MAG: hypothetical protein ACTSRU_04415 [Candidatus Hodarchaeales archaeon]